ncbi:MAG: class I SAM-dependent methyltransferase [Flammeovirgaceae bacterium]
MTGFWESKFTNEAIAWGYEPADSAFLAKALFSKNEVKHILIPGMGYGRNAKLFVDHGFQVTGIEISKTAIDLARTKIGLNTRVYHGSVTDMPYDQQSYDGIFCYALVHLLSASERKAFIRNCHQQLAPNGHMVFTVISKKSPMYGQGIPLSKDRFELPNGLSVFFYDSDAVEKEFGPYGLIDFAEIAEPIKFQENAPPLDCILITCKQMG